MLDTAPPIATERPMALIGGAFYLTGGLAVLPLAVWAPGTGHRVILCMLGLLTVFSGVLLMCSGTRFPRWVRVVMNPAGSGLVLAAILLAGHSETALALYWLFFFVPIDCFCFFAWRWAVLMTAWGLVAATLAAVIGGELPLPALLMMLLVAMVIACAVGWLVRFSSKTDWDPATNMLSRAGFERELDLRCAVAERNLTPFSLASVRIQVADADTTGSELLVRRMARMLSSISPEHATWARFRELEFLLIWEDLRGLDDFLTEVKSVTDALQPVSVGASDWLPGQTPTRMIAAATSGRHWSERNAGAVRRFGLIAEDIEELRTAITSSQLTVHYQPVVAAASGRIVGAEALVRWRHPERGLIAPDEFIGLAESCGLIGALGEFVLRQACRDAAGWPGGALDEIAVAVNVSGVQLIDPAFASMVSAALRESGLAPHRLVIEVTESTVDGDGEVAQQVLSELRRNSVEIAIDDFGTGYSNLFRLATLEVDIIKLDRSLLTGIFERPRMQSLVRGLIAMAADLDIRTIAEGVETCEEARMVLALGAAEIQGWYYGKAVPAAEFAELAALPGRVLQAVLVR